MNSAFPKIRAFTLIELMITIAIVVIILALAIPAFTHFMQNSYSVSISNNLVSTLKFARSEAIKRNAPVTICATADSTFANCGSAWNLGWLVFSDLNGDGGYAVGLDTILRIERLTGSNGNIVTSPATTSVTYNNVGFPIGNASNLTLSVSATNCKGAYARSIKISPTGSVTVTSANCP